MPPPDRLLRSHVLLAAPWFLAAGASAYRAWLHWRLLLPFGGELCGQGAIMHCGWCYAAVGAVLVGVAILLAPAARRAGSRLRL